MKTIGVSSAGFVVGEYVSGAKLTLKKVEKMRRLYSRGGVTFVELGKRFGVSRSAAARAITGKTWVSPVAQMVRQLEPADVRALSAGEGRFLLAAKANATKGSVERSMKAAGVGWDGVVRKQKHTHCKRGHLLAGRNLIVRKNSTQQCRECAQVRWREHARKKRKEASN